ncbi:hypothetical protein OPT61_g394 [Boeremia exigua]|uniref:Uncharacterized protein n=1 Tax=Boeremia exigua TaxID=749465 RepID=A0ACC2IU20_9PLEO|nr:hypothetical protein OPT61_g394 [Boeremia exigua]
MTAVEKQKSATGYSAPFLGDIVTVEVGFQLTPYKIHNALLIEHALYFRKALNGKWKEGEENKVRLDDVEDSDFEWFIKWLYTQLVPSMDEAWIEDI